MMTGPAALASCRADDLAPGTMVGSWEVEHELGRGGMGAVYAVVHAAIGKRAALKVVHRQWLVADDAAERFLTEARAVNAIEHPNIVDIFESGMLPDGRPYLVMERLRGKTLGDRLDEGRMPVLEIIDTLVPLCEALAAAHAAGIVHRDIKLDNVFLIDATCTQLGSHGGGPAVKLLDWGIASMVDGDGARPDGNQMVGTPRYVAPEQARGETVTPASDVYSLGILAYELFLEEPPFTAGSAAELLMQHLTEPPPLPREVWPQIPQALEELLLAMLAKTPALRPTIPEVTAALVELRKQLQRAISVQGPVVEVPERTSARHVVPLGHEPTELPPAMPVPATAPRWWTQWRWIAAAAMAVAVIGLRLFVHGGSPAAAAVPTTAPGETAPTASASAPAALAAAGVPVPVEVAPEPAEAEAEAVPTPAAAPPAKATPAPATRRPAAARPAPARRGRLHPDAVIDPY